MLKPSPMPHYKKVIDSLKKFIPRYIKEAVRNQLNIDEFIELAKEKQMLVAKTESEKIAYQAGFENGVMATIFELLGENYEDSSDG